jgi:hypothetical protein
LYNLNIEYIVSIIIQNLEKKGKHLLVDKTVKKEIYHTWMLLLSFWWRLDHRGCGGGCVMVDVRWSVVTAVVRPVAVVRDYHGFWVG